MREFPIGQIAFLLHSAVSTPVCQHIEAPSLAYAHGLRGVRPKGKPRGRPSQTICYRPHDRFVTSLASCTLPSNAPGVSQDRSREPHGLCLRRAPIRARSAVTVATVTRDGTDRFDDPSLRSRHLRPGSTSRRGGRSGSIKQRFS